MRDLSSSRLSSGVMDIKPLEIDRTKETEVRVLWSDGRESRFPARTLIT